MVKLMPKCIISKYITQKMYQLRYEIVHSVTKLYTPLRNCTHRYEIVHSVTKLYSPLRNCDGVVAKEYMFLIIVSDNSRAERAKWLSQSTHWRTLSLFLLFPLSGVRCCLQLFHRLICYSSPPSYVSCLLLPVSLLSCLLHISLYTVIPSQSWPPSSPPTLLT